MEKLLKMLKAFRDACNYISKVAFEHRVFNPVALHHMFTERREKFSLPANLATRARDRVAKAYKQGKIDFLNSRMFRWAWMQGPSDLFTSQMESTSLFPRFKEG
ncbi:hypothetical protein KEJ19_00465 [Candidatus Bathyarchaeota archaeon]|nr:hypothetical protein [Candidatus Bathyarchaeota archaeon]